MNFLRFLTIQKLKNITLVCDIILNRSITINGQFTCSPIENGRPNTGNQRTENFSITISAGYTSNSITYYLSGSPSEIQMLTEPHITSVSPSSGLSDRYNFVIKY